MFYIEWSEKDIKGLEELKIDRLITEIDDTGKVLREIGLNSQGHIVHKAPSDYDNYGLFDLQKVETRGLSSTVAHTEFERLWVELH